MIYSFLNQSVIEKGYFRNRRLFRGYGCAFRAWVGVQLEVGQVLVRGLKIEIDVLEEFVLKFINVGLLDPKEIARRMGISKELVDLILKDLAGSELVDEGKLRLTQKGRDLIEGVGIEEETWRGYAFKRGEWLLGIFGEGERELKEGFVGTEGKKEWIKWREGGLWEVDTRGFSPSSTLLLKAFEQYRRRLGRLDRQRAREIIEPATASIELVGDWEVKLVAVPACITSDKVMIVGEPVFGEYCEVLSQTSIDGLKEWLIDQAEKRKAGQEEYKERALKFAGIDVALLGEAGKELADAYRRFEESFDGKHVFEGASRDFLRGLEAGLQGLLMQKVVDRSSANRLGEYSSREENARFLKDLAKDMGFDVECIKKFFNVNSREVYSAKNFRNVLVLLILEQWEGLKRLAQKQGQALCMFEDIVEFRNQAVHKQQWEPPSRERMQGWVETVKVLMQVVLDIQGEESQKTHKDQNVTNQDLSTYSIDHALWLQADRMVEELGMEGRWAGLLRSVFLNELQVQNRRGGAAALIVSVSRMMEEVFKDLEERYGKEVGKKLPKNRKEIAAILKKKAIKLGASEGNWDHLFMLRAESLRRGKTLGPRVSRLILNASEDEGHVLGRLTRENPGWVSTVARVVQIRGHAGEKVGDAEDLDEVVKRAIELIVWIYREVKSNGQEEN